MEREFDVVVVGAGPAGEIAAGRLSERGGKRVAIVEHELVGGDCSFYACMPSKALLRPAEALAETARVPGAAEAVTGSLDVQAVLARRDEVIHNREDDNQLPWLDDRGIELIRGRAVLDGERRVRVGDDLLLLLAHDAVIIAVGSDPLFPPIPGLAEVGAWSNRELTVATEVPARLIVLGGGPVGVEMAQAWSSLGSQVTLVEAAERLIPREEPFAGDELREAFERLGISTRIGVRADAIARDHDEITVSLDDGTEVVGDRLLVAIGRRPRTAALGLESADLPGEEYLDVDAHMRVNGAPGLYAVGDVNGRSLLTHSGKYQARIAADHILGEDATATSDVAATPRVVFTDPQIAAVGMTLDDALSTGMHAVAVDIPTGGTAGASFYGRGVPGTTRFVVDADRQLLVGATFVGPDVTDFLQAATIAIVGQVRLSTLAHAIAPFPTRSELWLKFIEAYESQQRMSLHVGAQQ